MIEKNKTSPALPDLKNRLLQVRLDDDTVKTLDECAARLRTTRSEIVRKGIAHMHSYQWVSAAKPPEDGVTVLVITNGGRYDFAFFSRELDAWFNREVWFSEARRTGFEGEVITHWQPIPPLPLPFKERSDR